MAPKKLSEEEKRRRREQRQFANRVQSVFKNAGFTYLPTADIHRQFGHKKGELDAVFVYENVIVICEDTISANPWEHLKNKALLANEILNNKDDFVSWLQEEFKDRLHDFDYLTSRCQIFYLYFPKHGYQLSNEDEKLVLPLKVVQPNGLNYFVQLTQSIRKSARAEIFRFLGLQSSDVGELVSSTSAKSIETTIIYPDEITGLKNGVKIVSFMMSADHLLRNSYVLRKDNWEESIRLYQRLVDKKRIQDIRNYLVRNKSTFINNIIVSLPEKTTFKDSDGNPVSPDDVQDFSGHEMSIPDELNSICVIDGQHRIYAHYEGVDPLEGEIAKLRKKFHLLVTGLIFPAEMSPHERRRFESQIFLDINAKAKTVTPDVILFVETLKDPFSSYGVARQVLDHLNRSGPFQGKLQMSLMENAQIKTASIIKFALRYLVQISDGNDTLFTYWGDEAKRLKVRDGKDEALLDEYIVWCASVIETYFGAIKSTNKAAWLDPKSKILSTTSINGFLIALRRSLPAKGVLNFDGYLGLMKGLKYDFSKAKFEYASSQYAMFSRQILEDFGIAAEASTGSNQAISPEGADGASST